MRAARLSVDCFGLSPLRLLFIICPLAKRIAWEIKSFFGELSAGWALFVLECA